MPLLVVAALSARLMAEAAAREGFEVVALDVFGDADTRRAASRWQRIGDAAGARIDPVRTLAALRDVAFQEVAFRDVALRDAATRQEAIGWLAGAGFDGLPDLLEAGSRVLPLFGTAAADVRRLREPSTFFGFLRRHGLAHPPVTFERPADPAGWLCKDAAGTGGWHIHPAADARGSGGAAGGEQRYFQRRSAGVPMSATFIANGARVTVLGINRLTVRRLGCLPFVFHGVVGPLPVAVSVAAQVDHALRLIGAEFRLRGLGSLDFLLDGETARWLEVNPRLPASAALYEGRVAGGLMAAHLRACRDGDPAAPAPADVLAGRRDVRGTEIVFSLRRLYLGAAAARVISQWPGSHDQPAAGTRFAAGDPLCSVSAAGVDADAVARALAASRAGLLQRLYGGAGDIDPDDPNDPDDDDDNTNTDNDPHGGHHGGHHDGRLETSR